MKALISHISPLLAALAAGASIWLAVFVLQGSQGRPIPLVPAIGGAAGVVAAPSETPAGQAKTSSPSHNSFTRVRVRPVAPSRASSAVPRRAARPRLRPKPSARLHPAVPIQAPAPAVSQQPSVLSNSNGKALGHLKALAPRAGVGTRSRGQGKALGHRHGSPPGRSKKAQKPKAGPPRDKQSQGGQTRQGGKE